MGSPSARLKTKESLRPWLESGLEFFFNPGGITAEAAFEEQSVQQPSPVQQSPVQSPQNAAVRPSQGQQPQVQPQQQPVQQPTPAPQQSHPNLPEPWSGFLKFTKPGATVVLTYMELGLDLGGQSDPRRRSVLKNLQAHLRWPPGTINFWPMSAITDGTLQPDGRMFWQGWELWQTPYIACFGEEALKVILPDADPGLTTHILENVTVYVLPPISRLISLLPHEQQLAVDILTKIRT